MCFGQLPFIHLLIFLTPLAVWQTQDVSAHSVGQGHAFVPVKRNINQIELEKSGEQENTNLVPNHAGKITSYAHMSIQHSAHSRNTRLIQRVQTFYKLYLKYAKNLVACQDDTCMFE